MYCKKCGTQNPDDARFCNECGNRLALEAAQPTIAREQPAEKFSGCFAAVVILLLLIGGLCLLLYVLGPRADGGTLEKPKRVDDLPAGEQQAIKHVQNYKPTGGLSIIEGIQLWIAVHKSRYDIEPIGWAAFESRGGWTVWWGFKLNGEEEHAEWWYNPSTGVASPNDNWAEDMTP